MIRIIDHTDDLAAFCETMSHEAYITIDTEFMRERTYYPLLCLIQIAGAEEEAIIDPLADGMSLEPLFPLLSDSSVTKVFHAGGQDVEILYHLTGEIPSPIYDTQIAAMVLGYGDQVGYESLVKHVTGGQLDKSQRFTDWSHRPLTEAQLKYAIADVTHLREVYEKMEEEIERRQRRGWMIEELAKLKDANNYVTEPEEAWLRLKRRDRKPHYLARLQALAAWREKEAIRKNKPRGWILNDDALQEIALTNPKSEEKLQRIRTIKKHLGQIDLKLIAIMLEDIGTLHPHECPKVKDKKPLPTDLDPTKDVLKILLKVRCQEENVAQKLVASVDNLSDLLMGNTDIPAMNGWRYDIFGKDARALLEGRLHMTVNDKKEVVFTES